MLNVLCGVGTCHKHIFWKLCGSVNGNVGFLGWVVRRGLNVLEGEAGDEML